MQDNIPGGKQLLQKFETLDFVPFDPVSKRTEATVQWTGPPPAGAVQGTKGGKKYSFQGGETFRVAKGAPQVVLAMCPDHEIIDAAVTEKVILREWTQFRALRENF